MHLSQVDLNLFTVFDAIYREGGITPASKRLHLSQPAVSHALARLRELIGDPLFERQGNEMVPTPRARVLAMTITKSLGSLQEMLNRTPEFEPLTSHRSFRIAMREMHESAFASHMIERIIEDAPNVAIATVRIERRDLQDDLQRGELDAAVDIALPLSAEIHRESLRAQPLAVLARRGHPSVNDELHIANYVSLQHVLITGRRHGGGLEDAILNRDGLSRHIRVRCQTHSVASEIVSKSDMLATMPLSYAEIINRVHNNQLLPFPLSAPPLELYVYWPANADADPANQWLRSQLRAALGQGSNWNPMRDEASRI